ncbi:MAG: RNA polymerase sigma factor region1.1 domain-containing protein, partial [Gammaproteobacteria bacterium]
MDNTEQLDQDDEQSQLKLLIAKGKEQGFLTYHEVNDHLPEDIVDPEQIEDIISMINDMGITVHETAPDLDLLIGTDASTPDEDAAAEAAAALASVDAEFGRTTDPVRMYMREMGTVDLLTREGEIKIAKRIEEGLNQMLEALACYPGTIDLLLAGYAKVEDAELKLADIVIGFTDQLDNYPAANTPNPANPNNNNNAANAASNGDDNSSDDSDDNETEAPDNSLDPEEVRERVLLLAKQYKKVLTALKKYGKDHKSSDKAQNLLTEKFMELRLAPKFIDLLTVNVREVVDTIRTQEREVMAICIKQCKMPRADFIESFPGHETDLEWAK